MRYNGSVTMTNHIFQRWLLHISDFNQKLIPISVEINSYPNKISFFIRRKLKRRSEMIQCHGKLLTQFNIFFRFLHNNLMFFDLIT